MVCAKFHKICFRFQRDFVNFKFQLHFRIQKDKNLLKGKKFFDKKKLNTFLLGENEKMRKDMTFLGMGFTAF